MEALKQEFFDLCCDCLYWGYFWGYITKTYFEFIQELGKPQAKTIYNKALAKMGQL